MHAPKPVRFAISGGAYLVFYLACFPACFLSDKGKLVWLPSGSRHRKIQDATRNQVTPFRVFGPHLAATRAWICPAAARGGAKSYIGRAGRAARAPMTARAGVILRKYNSSAGGALTIVVGAL